MLSLYDLQTGKTSRVNKIYGESLRLLELGFTKGAHVEPLFYAPFALNRKNAMRAYRVRGVVIALRSEDAMRIEVEYI